MAAPNNDILLAANRLPIPPTSSAHLYWYPHRPPSYIKQNALPSPFPLPHPTPRAYHTLRFLPLRHPSATPPSTSAFTSSCILFASSSSPVSSSSSQPIPPSLRPVDHLPHASDPPRNGMNNPRIPPLGKKFPLTFRATTSYLFDNPSRAMILPRRRAKLFPLSAPPISSDRKRSLSSRSRKLE